MDSSAAQISTTMTINTYGANEIRPPAPPLRNKGRVNHTVGVNRANNASAPIATECVKVCDSSTSTEIVQPIKISNDTNAGTNAIEIKRIGNLVSDFHGGDSNGESDTNNRDAMYQCSQSQVSASPPREHHLRGLTPHTVSRASCVSGERQKMVISSTP